MTNRQILCAIALPLLAVVVIVAAQRPRAAITSARENTAGQSSAAAKIHKTFGKMPLLFIENRGQVGARSAYYLEGRGASVSFRPQGISFTLVAGEKAANPHRRVRSGNGRTIEGPDPRRTQSVDLEFLGADPAVQPVGEDPAPTVVSYFTGSPDQWKVGLKTYNKLVYRDVWPGIDARYSTVDGRLKYTFVVAPGADPKQIRLVYRGATSVRVDEDGALEVSTALGSFRDERPYVYQEINGEEVEVTSSFSLASYGRSYEYGFRLGPHDPSRPLIVDPAFVYAGFIGGGLDDRGLSVAVNSLGEAYICGSTLSSATFSNDVYVAKVLADGSAYAWIALMTGTGNDEAFDIDIDAAGNSYVTGATNSPNFPVFLGPDLTLNGGDDAFVSKINPTGTALIYSGFIGGTGIDFAEGIKVDAFGNAYVTGPTHSTQKSFPAKVGPDLTFNGGFDLFVAKVKAVPSDRVVKNNFFYCGYIGGRGDDIGVVAGFLTAGHIDIDAAGNAYVSGMTKSTESTFPDGNGFGPVPGADQTHNGLYDAFVVKVNAAGTGLDYATYVGGSGDDFGFGMAVDSAGNAHFTGDTSSSNFPVTVGPDLTYNGNTDAFVAKLNPTGTALVFSGFVGGSDFDQGLGLTKDGAGNLYLIGHTHSADFPVVLGPDTSYNGAGANGDGFLTKVSASGTMLLYSGFIGGTGEDGAFWVRLDSAGNAYVVGDTDSTETTFPDGGGLGALPGPDKTQNGLFDGFVAKISP